MRPQVAQFAWAPDGQRLAAVPPRSTGFEEPDHLIIVTVDGEVERTVASEPGLRDVAWSPDGTRLAYAASDLAGGRFSTWRVYVVSADGTGARRVGGEDARPRTYSWSPDGTRLAVQRLVERSTTHWSFDVDVVDVATGAVLTEIGFAGRTLVNPVWSAAGDRLYLSARDDVFEDPPADGADPVDPDGEGRSGLMVTDLQGEHARDLHTGGQGYAVGPAVGVCPQAAWYDVGHAAFSDRGAIPPVHRTNVDCAVHHQIVHGFADATFRPTLDVRRDQMASFVAGALDAAGAELPEASDVGFTDVPDDSPHAHAINRLAAAGVVQGGPGGLPADAYGPGLRVRRDQMASFLLRTVEQATGAQATSQTQQFDDAPEQHALHCGQRRRRAWPGSRLR
ncbi:MAG: S-layer homology domain-containing protein [Egibacteraceae bacterium]